MKKIKNISVVYFYMVMFFCFIFFDGAIGVICEVSTLEENPNIEVAVWKNLQNSYYFSPNKRYVMSEDLKDGSENKVVLLDLLERKNICEFNFKFDKCCFAFSCDDKFLAIGFDKRIMVWDIQARACIDSFDLEHESGYWDFMCFYPNINCLFIYKNGSVWVRDFLAKKVCFNSPCSDVISMIKFSQCGKFYFLETRKELDEFNIDLCDAKSKETIHSFTVSLFDKVRFSLSGRFLIPEGHVSELWDISPCACVGKYDWDSIMPGANSVKLSPGGSFIYAKNKEEKKSVLFDIMSGVCGPFIDGLIKAISPSDEFFITAEGSNGHRFCLFDLRTMECLYKFNFKHSEYAVHVNRDGTQIIFLGVGLITVFTDLLVQRAIQENKNGILALSQALHPRCGGVSPANVLTQNDLRLIYDMIGVTPWKTVFGR